MGWSVSSLQLGGFSENGGFAGLNAKAAGTQTHTSSTLGIRTYSEFIMGGNKVKLNATLGWKHVWGQYDVNRSMAFNVGGPEFMIAAVPITSNTALVGLSGQVEIGRNSWLELSYMGQFGQGFVDQSAMDEHAYGILRLRDIVIVAVRIQCKHDVTAKHKES